MPCYRPIQGRRAPGGRVVFGAGGYVDRPVSVSCGQCVGCRVERADSWRTRLVHEATLHEHSCFITLTYADEHLPPDGSLDVRHWQLFAKRLRKRRGPFRFYHCGEYGPQTQRPHYHAVLFGVWFSDAQETRKSESGHPMFESPTLTDVWGKGIATVQPFSAGTAAYVARYVTKKVTGPPAEAHYGGRRPEYATMSRRPGIGAAFLDRHGETDVFRHDQVVIDGQTRRPPGYYDSALGAADPARLEETKRRRRSKVNPEHQTPERRRVRERVAEARLGARCAL